MPIGRTSRFFKVLVFCFVAIIFLVVATRQRISRTPTLDELDGRKAFMDEVEAKLSGKDANSKDPIILQINEAKHNNDEKLLHQGEIKGEIVPNIEDQAESGVQDPFDESMPGAYLRSREPAPTDQSYCKYNYRLPYDLVYSSKDYVFPPQLGNKSQHRVMYNVTEAYRLEDIPQVTYATHMTANFAYFIPQLLKQWEGPITVAAFVPDLDSAFFLEQITHFCYCEPEMHRVSVHIVTHRAQAFSKKDMYFERPENCLIQDSSKIGTVTDHDDTLIYPVNVVRNIARTSALTKYVLLSDVELMPSKGLASGFLDMIKEFNKTNPKEVFVVPIFEVEETESIPENKGELLKLLDEQKAVYFHGMVCKHCQKFPGLDDWISSGYSQSITPLVTVKRHQPYHRWEPIFIGTNAEPLYSELLSWEGLQDKMTQSLEMCLQNYDFTILDNAFLCHWPGIKKQKVADEEWRAGFVKQNRKVYQTVIETLQESYKDIPECMVNFTADSLPEEKDAKDEEKAKNS